MAKKYLQYFPKPVLADLLAGRWLPVIGAGMSRNARLPAGKEMPLWVGLGELLGSELTDFAPTGALDAISAYEHEYGRPKLIERLTEVLLIKDAAPGEVHAAFCSIPFDIVCTTNFDFLLERQYEATPRYAYPVIEEEQLSINNGSAGTLLFKLHGDLYHPSRLVVTEEDYDGFLTRYPLIATYLANLLITKTAVFVGYSLDDPDFRQIRTVVADRLGRAKRISYCLTVGARPGDFARYERRGVKVINLPGARDKYGEVLTDAFKELREYMRDNVISVSHVTEEEPLRELRLPRDAATRLCFFSIPIDLLSFYRSRIFPTLEEIGFVPITADDVVSPGDNINAKIDALIDRAAIILIDLSSQWTRAEYEMAVARARSEPQSGARQAPKIILVLTKAVGASAPRFFVDSHANYVIYRSENILDESDKFVSDLTENFRGLAIEIGLDHTEEPSRLLAKGEFRAAVISAMTQLESILRRNLDLSPQTRRPLTMGNLIEFAVERELISEIEAARIRDWTKDRNNAVHTNVTIGRQRAREIVEGAQRIILRDT